MALRDVRHLMREHRGELRFGLGRGDEAGMHADIAARQRKRVDALVANAEELEILPGAGKTGADLGEVVADLGIVDVRRLGEANLAHDLLADAPLHQRRQRAVAASQVGQRLHGRLGLRKSTRRKGSGQHDKPDGKSHPAMISPAMAGSVKKLTHFDSRGAVHMVDVGAKPSSHRVALASGRILMQAATLRMIAAGTAKKGDVLGVARLAAIQAAKRTASLIPLAHPLALSRVAIDFERKRKACGGEDRGARGMPGPDRRRDGGAHRCGGRSPHHLRHAEGGRSGHDAHRRAARGKKRRPFRGIPPRATLECRHEPDSPGARRRLCLCSRKAA